MSKFERSCGWLGALFLTLTVLILAGPRPALAVLINVPTTFANADNSDATPGDNAFTVDTLTIANGGSITCNDPAAPADASACNITIVVTGDMEMEAGSAIFAENRWEAVTAGASPSPSVATSSSAAPTG